MNARNIQAFIAITEFKTFSKAAERLFISQSTITHRILDLENELGFKLFNRARGKQTLSLTEKGYEFIPIANQWLELNKYITDWISNDTKTTISIGSVDSLNSYLFGDLYVNFLQNQNVSLKIYTMWTNTIFEMLEDYKLDLGIVSKTHRNHNLTFKSIFKENLVLISHANFSRYPNLVDPKNLKIENELYVDWGIEFQIWHNKYWPPNEDPHVRIDTPALIRDCIKLHNTWAVVPWGIAEILKNELNIRISNLTDPPDPRSIYLVKHRNINPIKQESISVFESYLYKFIQNSEFCIIEN
ncbi:MAG: LysR family transcriptional regulator [Tissierellia bacterium]|nr:LysR family transcriptional regulator [Tissierellia bacterium]